MIVDRDKFLVSVLVLLSIIAFWHSLRFCLHLKQPPKFLSSLSFFFLILIERRSWLLLLGNTFAVLDSVCWNAGSCKTNIVVRVMYSPVRATLFRLIYCVIIKETNIAICLRLLNLLDV